MSPDDPVTRRIFEARDEIDRGEMAVLSFRGSPHSEHEAGDQKRKNPR